MSNPASPNSAPSLSDDDVVTLLQAAGCVFAADEAALIIGTAGTPAELAAMVDRRVAGHPLEQVLGWAEFHGLRIALDPGVFVPRRRTEFLAGRAAALARATVDRLGTALVVDLCCGSGAVAAAIAASVAGADVYAADLDPVAVRCARRNLAAVAGGAFADRVAEGDLFDALPPALRGGIDVLVANVPYVPSAEIALLPAEARDFEPALALDGGGDGLDVMRRVVADAAGWLGSGGRLLVESSERQVPSAVAAFTAGGLTTEVATCEDLYATIVIGTRPAGAS